MAIRTGNAHENQESGPKLVPQTAEQKVLERDELINESKIKRLQLASLTKQAAALRKEIKANDDRLETLASTNATARQLKILQELAVGDDELDGQVMDLSNVKTLDEVRGNSEEEAAGQ